MNSSQSAVSHFIRGLFAEKKACKISTSEQKINYLQLKKNHPSSPELDDNNIFALQQSHDLKPTLTITSPKKTVQQIPLYPDSELIIGRHPLSDIKITGFRISDFHAKARLSDDKVYIEDLHSQSGTFVNGQRLTPGFCQELLDKTTVTIKNHRFYFEIPKPAQTALAEIEEPTQVKVINDYICSHLINEYQSLHTWKSSLTELLVTAIINETADTKTIRLAAEKPLLFHYQPGQFVTLNLTIDGQQVNRSYSIASSPSRPFCIEITVKKTPGGLVSNWLHNQLQLGDRLKVKGPMGRFSCFNYPAAKLLLIAAGSGVVPIMSMLRWLTDVSAEVDIQVVLSFRYPDDIIYHRELKLLKKRHKNLHLHITLTGNDIGKKNWLGPRGRVNKSLLKRWVPDLSKREVFICGPDLFMDEVGKHLLALKLTASQCHKESFNFVSPVVSPLAKFDAGQLQNRSGKYQVNFAKSAVQAVTNGDENLLMLAHLYGVKIDNECLNGSCGECMVKCLQGDIIMSDQIDISEKEKQAGWIYSCSAFPKSDLTLDI